MIRCSYTTATRRGLTRAGLLIVLAVFGTFLALLFPVIQYLRESANRSACTDNLKRIAFGLGAFEAKHDRYPSAATGINKANTKFTHHGTLPQMLNFLGRDDLHATLDFEEHYGEGPANRQVMSTLVREFCCPSDRSFGRIERPPGLSFARGNYVASGGSGYMIPPIKGNFRYADIPTPASVDFSNDGVFQFARGRRQDEIVDGLAHTAAFSEIKAGREDIGGYYQTDPRGRWVNTFNANWYSHSQPPNPQMPDVGNCTEEMAIPCLLNRFDAGRSMAPLGDKFFARSMHPGGANVAFCDGHVRFVTNDIAILTWRALGTIAGKEPIVNAANR